MVAKFTTSDFTHYQLFRAGRSREAEERRTRVNGKEGKERRERRREVCVQTVVDVGGRLHFSVHLLNVAEIRSVAAMFCSLKASPDV